jgi:hypothetical protein
MKQQGKNQLFFFLEQKGKEARKFSITIVIFLLCLGGDKVE